MFKSVIKEQRCLFVDKISFCVMKFQRHLTKNSRINEFESYIKSEKLKAKNYFLIEDKCNVLSKLNVENVSLLLETKVNKIFKWVFNGNSCALVEINDNNYSMRREIRRNFGLNSNHNYYNYLRYITLNSCPKFLNISSAKVNSDDVIQRMTIQSKALDITSLTHFKSNEEILQCLLSQELASDFDVKLRFYIISQLEQFVSNKYFKGFHIQPFGSSISGLGTPYSDLDLVLMPSKLSEDSKSEFEDRKQLKNKLNLIADLFESSLPIYSHFSRILSARIPIIKFAFDLAPVDIDLSIQISQYSVHHGVHMSAFLNYCIQLNPQIRDLILLLRIWGKQHNLLKPDNWPTYGPIFSGFKSFHFTSLVIFFLQKEQLVPPMKDFLIKTDEIFIPSKRHFDTIEMLTEFFQFVLSLEFEWEALSILNGKTFINPDQSPIWMENPFDTKRNMCQNIVKSKFRKFLEITNACLDVMKTKDFSLALIFDPNLQNRLSPTKNKIYSNRINVQELFDE